MSVNHAYWIKRLERNSRLQRYVLHIEYLEFQRQLRRPIPKYFKRPIHKNIFLTHLGTRHSSFLGHALRPEALEKVDTTGQIEGLRHRLLTEAENVGKVTRRMISSWTYQECRGLDVCRETWLPTFLVIVHDDEQTNYLQNIVALAHLL